MDTKNGRPFHLDAAWKPHKCSTIQEYLQESYGKQDLEAHPHAFRGVSKRHDDLRPSIDRRDITDAEPVEVETVLLEEFLLRAWNDLTPQERHRYLLAEARWGSKRNTATMVVARHRLVPTRCVDWSDSRLRALFFACNCDHKCDGEVWWFNRSEFDRCVAAQWPALFGKHGNVEAEIEQDFIDGRNSSWFTALKYMLIPDDRLDRQKGWITIAGRLGSCHATEIHRIGVRQKGRLVIPAGLKHEAIRLLEQLGITKESLGLNHANSADEIAREIKTKFDDKYDAK